MRLCVRESCAVLRKWCVRVHRFDVGWKFYFGAGRARAVRICAHCARRGERTRRRMRFERDFDQAFAWRVCAHGVRSCAHTCKPHICLLCAGSRPIARTAPRCIRVWKLRRIDGHMDKLTPLRRPLAVVAIRFGWVRRGLSVAGAARTNLLTRKKSGNNFCHGVTHA